MKYNELTLKKQRKSTRVGRGISAGRGKTAGRGTKGQGSRKSTLRPGFEGGQMPIYMRLPKLRGFKSKRAKPQNVRTSQLELVKGVSIDNHSLAEAGLTSNPHVPVKLIFDSELKAKKTVKLQSASAKAIEAIQKAGGSFDKVDQIARPSTKSKES